MTAPLVEALGRFFSQADYPMVFTGAGVSARAGLPNWKSLVEQLAEGIRSFDPLTTQQMLECVRTGDYTLAVDYFRLTKKVLEGDKRKLLARLLGNFDAQPIVPVAKLPFRGSLTTNFDRSILDAIAIGRQRSARDYRFGDTSFKQAQWEDGLFVARIHGAVETPDTMILSEMQFDALLKDEGYIDFLRACFVHRNVLFIGFSFYDPAIRHVFLELDKRFGAASSGRHMAFLPSDVNSEFLQKANRLNIEVVQYDPVDNHATLWDALSSFQVDQLRQENSSKVNPFDFTKRYLAACYARATTQDASNPLREAVMEGIVSALLQEVAPQAISQRDLLEKVRLSLGIKGREAGRILQAASRSLVEAGLCRKLKGDNARGSMFAWTGSAQEADSLGNAITALTESISKRAYLQEGWTTGKEVNDTMSAFFGQLIRRRGWDLGAAFAMRRPPENAAIQSLLNECAVGLSAFDRERLLRISANMLRHPSQEESELLGELGRVSFAVELAFQSPSSALLHKETLPRHIYFDASVLMPALVQGHPFRQVYRDAIKRLKEAAASAAIKINLKVCTVYLNEIISHRRNAEEYAAQLGDDFPTVARSDALFHGASNVNVFVGAYANWIETNGELRFKNFLSRYAPYTTESQLSQWLAKQGFTVINSMKGPKYAEIYSRLEKVYANQLSRGKQPILIEHDAAQLSILDMDFLKSEKTLFVTADRQLQAAIAESKFEELSELMVSHVGLIQFIQLLLGVSFP